MKPLLEIDPLILAFRRAHRSFPSPKLTKCRGNLNAQILLIAPRPTEDDLENNLPLTGGAAQQLHGLLKAHAEIDTERDCLVMPGSVIAKKQSKLLVEPFKSLPLKFHARFKLIVCIGGENFKYFFGAGKKSSIQTLANGNLLFLPKFLGNTPLFVLPEIELLDPPWHLVKPEEHWKLESMQERALKWFSRILPKLGEHYAKLK